MNLVQKLPIGLGLACIMMLSSCSKEDVSAPQPQAEGVNESSALRVNDGLGVVPIFPSTFGAAGIATYPLDWSRASWSNADPQQLPTGTSSLTHLWGSNLLPWAKPLPQIPGIQNMNSIVTFSTNKTIITGTGINRATVTTKLKKLKVGKNYSITFYVASTMRNLAQGTFVPAYASRIQVNVTGYGSFSKYVDLSNAKAIWVKKEIILQAVHQEEEVSFSAYTAKEGEFAYAHVFVDNNSIKEVN